MLGLSLSGGNRISTIGSAVLTQYRIMTGRQTDRHISTANTALVHNIAPVTKFSDQCSVYVCH